MKRLLLAGLAVAVLAAPGLCASGPSAESSASCHVRVTVDPNVTMSAAQPTVDAGSVQTGDFTATCVFRVDANMQILTLYAEASHLYKGNDPTNADVAPIPLKTSAGIPVQLANGHAMGGQSDVLVFPVTPAQGSCDGFTTYLTDPKAFESSQNGHFSQEVTLRVTWCQDDPEKPMGEYSGCVKLTAMVFGDSVPVLTTP